MRAFEMPPASHKNTSSMPRLGTGESEDETCEEDRTDETWAAAGEPEIDNSENGALLEGTCSAAREPENSRKKNQVSQLRVT